MSEKSGLGDLVSQLAATNIELWHEEDNARVTEVAEVARAKRSIDRLNQKRNDLIEKIDDAFIVAVAKDPAMAETFGSLVDKISIAELKIFHTRERAARADATAELRALCEDRLKILEEQRGDLVEEMNALTRAWRAGAYRPKVYRQFKMYNDPRFQLKK